ncbi:ebh [Symbiodinium sp. CCMP2456]|nr:ebh [Symbiodinium sp. CCMP2456]
MPPPRRSWLVDLLIYRVQRIYQTWPWATAIPSWETFALDRTQWANHSPWWVRHWVDEDAPPTFEYLQERQVIVLKGSKGMLDCFLRPSKDFTEVPYTSPLMIVKQAKMPCSFVWGKAENGRCAVVVSLANDPKRMFVVHTHAHDGTMQAMSATVLRLALKVQGILAHWGTHTKVFLEAGLLQRTVFHRQVPLALLAEVTEALNLFDRQGGDCLFMPPAFKDHSPWLHQYRMVTLVDHHTKYLARTLDYSSSAPPRIVTTIAHPAMDVENKAERTLEQTELDTADVLRVAEAILEEVSSDFFTCGAFVRVKAGLRTNTARYPWTCKLLARFLAEEFPGDSFLTMRLQKNVMTQPHKDSQNTFLPSLLCNLSPGAPGGTWVEDVQGTTWMPCPDGVDRPGRVLQGRKYRLSARQLWHANVPHAEDRMLLIGWVPAGWTSLAEEDAHLLKSMGYIWPSTLQGHSVSVLKCRARATTFSQSGVQCPFCLERLGAGDLGCFDVLVLEGVFSLGRARHAATCQQSAAHRSEWLMLLSAPLQLGSRALPLTYMAASQQFNEAGAQALLSLFATPEQYDGLLCWVGAVSAMVMCMFMYGLIASRSWSKNPSMTTPSPAAGAASVPTVGPPQQDEELKKWMVAALSEVLPDVLGPMLQGRFDALSEALLAANSQHAADSAGTNTAVLAVDTLSDTVTQALDSKLALLQPLDKMKKAFSEHQAAVETVLLKLKSELTTAVIPKALVAELEGLNAALTKAFATSNTTEQNRFQTLDKATKSSIEALESTIKSRFDLMSKETNDKLDHLNSAFCKTLGEHNKAHLDIDGFLERVKESMDSLDSVVSKVETACGKLAQGSDRVENMLLEKLTSLQGDTNRLLGELGQTGRDINSCLRTNSKSITDLQQAVTTMGSAMGGPPKDSSGVTEAVDITKNMQSHLAELRGQVNELVDALRELRDTVSRTNARPAEIRVDPVQGSPAVGQPSVINLASRIPPAPVAGGGQFARAILASGREVLVPEDDIIGPPANPYIHTFGGRR